MGNKTLEPKIKQHAQTTPDPLRPQLQKRAAGSCLAAGSFLDQLLGPLFFVIHKFTFYLFSPMVGQWFANGFLFTNKQETT